MDLNPFYEKAALVLKEMNLTVEINSSGYDYPALEAYPSPAFLKILFKHGVPVTFGSDSHSPEHLGRHFDKALKTAIDAGYNSTAFFDKRKRIIKPF
jgi:histidinol-phosphatase (PHP family)